MLSDRYHEPKDNDASQNPHSMSARLQNTIELFLAKESFAFNEPAVGHVLITLHEAFEAKKLTLSILGEIVSQGAVKIKKESTFKKLKTSISGIGRPNIQRTFTAKKEEAPEAQKAEPNRRMSKTLTRTFTIMSRMAMSPNTNLQNKKSIVPEMRNRELFCHYNIALFTFKTSTLPPGVYKLPFKFTFASTMLPTAEYNGDNKKFQLGVNYKIVADLEENAEEDYFGEKMIMPPLKSVKEIKIYKPTHPNKKALETAQPQTLITDVSGKLKIPTALCFAKNDIEVKLNLNISTFVLGDTIKFTLESFNKPLKQNKTKIFLNIVEVPTSFGNRIENPKSLIINPPLSFKDSDTTSPRPGTVITGEIPIPQNLNVTFKTPSLDIEHFFELILTYNAGIRKQGISLRIPIVLKKKEEEPTDSGRRKSAFTKHEDPAENADDGVMILPLAKFKLDEKFNLLTRTAEMMNHEFL